MNQKQVKFKMGAQVTTTSPFFPPLEEGSFVFDTQSLALYIDLENRRVQVKDPLKLSLTGGTITGDTTFFGDTTFSGEINVVDQNGTTTSGFSADTGIIYGNYLETTGEFVPINPENHEIIPEQYAVIDDNGRIRSITKEQMIAELNLGTLAHKNNIVFEPEKRLPAKILNNTETLSFDTEFISAISAHFIP